MGGGVGFLLHPHPRPNPLVLARTDAESFENLVFHPFTELFRVCLLLLPNPPTTE